MLLLINVYFVKKKPQLKLIVKPYCKTIFTVTIYNMQPGLTVHEKKKKEKTNNLTENYNLLHK